MFHLNFYINYEVLSHDQPTLANTLLTKNIAFFHTMAFVEYKMNVWISFISVTFETDEMHNRSLTSQ